MSKIICDVCGTSYPDTANQCPICGNLKSDNNTSGGVPSGIENSGYAYVKGGRFSHANVRKRNGGKTELPRVAPVRTAPAAEEQANSVMQETAPAEEMVSAIPVQEPEQETVIPVVMVEPEMPKAVKESEEPVAAAPVAPPRRRKRRKKENRVVNIVLMLIVILLVLAIVGVCAYITLHLLDRDTDPSQPAGSSSSQLDPTGSSSKDIPCTGLQIIPATPQTFTSVGQSLLLEVKKYPGNTTDTVVFTSSDPYIATVDAAGKIVAVADGNVTITVTCGEQVVELQVTCQVGKAPEYPDDPPEGTTTQPGPSTDPSIPEAKLELQYTDITMNTYGETSNLYAGQLDPASITWTSEDESVVTVTNGIVKAIGQGTTKIIAQYGEQKVECIIRCSSSVVKPEYFLYTQYGKLSSNDVTIKEGESLTFSLRDADGNKITEGVTYSVSDEAHLSVNENGKIKGLEVDSTTTVYLYIEYEGVVYKCIIRIKNVN